MVIISSILSLLVHFAYYLLLCIFHPIQVITHWVLGNKARVKVVNVLNFFLVRCLNIAGSRISYHGLDLVPKDRTVIIVANHQSIYDIPAVVTSFKDINPAYISKKELAKGLPSVSYNLKHGGSALIDRKNGSQAIREIIKLGRRIEKENGAVCIFPEGTRSRTGKLGKFQSGGINTLLKVAPSAIIVPFVIDGHSKLVSKGSYTRIWGQRIKYTVLEPIEPKDFSPEELVPEIKRRIESTLAN